MSPFDISFEALHSIFLALICSSNSFLMSFFSLVLPLAVHLNQLPQFMAKIHKVSVAGSRAPASHLSFRALRFCKTARLCR